MPKIDPRTAARLLDLAQGTALRVRIQTREVLAEAPAAAAFERLVGVGLLLLPAFDDDGVIATRPGCAIAHQLALEVAAALGAEDALQRVAHGLAGVLPLLVLATAG